MADDTSLRDLVRGLERAGVASGQNRAAAVWSVDGRRLLWVDERLGAVPHLAAEDGKVLPGVAARLGLADMARSLRGTDTTRLLRVHLSANRLQAPTVVPCRLATMPDGRELLVTFLPATASEDEFDPDGHGALPAGLPTAPPPTSALPGGPAPVDTASTRFVWASDREGIWTRLDLDRSGPFGELAPALGHRWTDLDGTAILDESREIASGLSTGTAFRRAPLLWRRLDGWALPGDLTGTPLRDGSGGFDGFRGFGHLRPDEARSDVADLFTTRMPRTPEPEPPRPEGAAPADGPTGGASWGLTGLASETVASLFQFWLGQARGAEPSGETVLAPVASMSAAETLPPPSPSFLAPAAGAPDEATTRDAADGAALREIATILDRSEEPRAESRDAGDPAATESGAGGGTDDMAAFVGELPIPGVVVRDGVPLAASRAFLDAVGCATLADLIGKGVLDRANEGTFGGPSQRWSARAATVPWRGRPATLLYRVPDDGETRVDEPTPGEPEAASPDPAGIEEVLAIASECVLLADASMRVRSVFGDPEGVLGRSAADLLGSSLSDIVAPADHRTALTCLEAVKAAEPGDVHECDVRLRGEARRPVQLRVGRLPGGPDAETVVGVRPLDRLSRMAEELASSRHVAEQALKQRTDLLARVSHEIRAPLTAIVGFAELMMEERFGPIGNERYKGYSADIQRSGNRVLAVVEDVLALADAASRDTAPDRTAIDLNALVRDAVGQSALAAARARTVLRTSYMPGAARILCDGRAGRQIVCNVVAEAVRLSGRGGQVIVSTATVADEVVLRVRDTQPTPSPAQAIDTLTPFRRATDARSRAEPSFALSIVKALAEANGGRVALVSRPEGGVLIEVAFEAAPTTLKVVAAAE